MMDVHWHPQIKYKYVSINIKTIVQEGLLCRYTKMFKIILKTSKWMI